jgi:hypothetical protein
LVGVALLNPHGAGLFLRSWELANHPNIRFMEEWKPLPLKSAAGYVFLVSVLLLIPVLRWSPARLTPMQVLLLIGFGFQTLAHARVLVWWIMVFTWVVLPHLQALYHRYLPPVLEETGPADLRKTILAVLAGGVLLIWSAPVQWLVWGEAPLDSQRVTPETPLKAAAFLKEEYQKDQKRAVPRLKRGVFASETLGDYLLWDLRLEPPVRVSCYTHVHLFTPAHWLDCFTVKSGGHGWQAVLDRLGVQFLVVEPDLHPHLAEQVRAAPDDWEIVAEEPILVARRK